MGSSETDESGVQVSVVLAIAIALPFTIGFLFESPGVMALVVFVELVIGCFYRPTQIVAVPLFIVLMLLSLFLPFCSPGGAPSRPQQCRDNLKQIALALLNYHDEHDSFPPAYVIDAAGQPMHSWRVLVLPYMEETALYEQYRFDEPWNGLSNSRLAGRMPSVFRCPSEPNRESVNTSYVLVAGEGTPWTDAESPHMDDITRARGASNTIAVVEIVGSKIHWMEPRDFTPDQAFQQFESILQGRHHSTEDGRPALNVAFADGSVRGVRLDEIKERLIGQGGETVKRPEE